jgi:peroxiredoxin
MAVEVGSIAPDFTLPDHRHEPFTLSSLRGGPSVVLAFFPLAFSEWCSRQFRVMGERAEAYAAEGAVVLAVSVDHSTTLAAFREATGAEKVTFLSDFLPRGEVCRAYGVFVPGRGHGGRATFVIDRDGVVRSAEYQETPLALPDEDRLMAGLAACPR